MGVDVVAAQAEQQLEFAAGHFILQGHGIVALPSVTGVFERTQRRGLTVVASDRARLQTHQQVGMDRGVRKIERRAVIGIGHELHVG